MSKGLETREEHWIKNLILPIVIAIVTGVGSSYLATQITLAVVEIKMNFMQDEISAIKEILKDVRENQILISLTTERLSSVERTQDSIIDQTKDRYTRSESIKDFKYLEEKIKELEYKLKPN